MFEPKGVLGSLCLLVFEPAAGGLETKLPMKVAPGAPYIVVECLIEKVLLMGSGLKLEFLVFIIMAYTAVNPLGESPFSACIIDCSVNILVLPAPPATPP